VSRHPTVNQVKELCDNMRRLDWRAVADRLNQAIERDKRGGDMQPDGYPSSTMNGGTGGSELTSVEAAVEARIRGVTDRYHDNVDEACAHLLELVNHAGALRHRLDNLDQLLGADPNVKQPATCAVCTGIRREAPPVYATGTVGDRLPRSMALCRDCYSAVEQSAKGGSRRGKLPTAEQVRWHQDHGRWKLRSA
jgi:hypothetical protein